MMMMMDQQISASDQEPVRRFNFTHENFKCHLKVLLCCCPPAGVHCFVNVTVAVETVEKVSKQLTSLLISSLKRRAPSPLYFQRQENSEKHFNIQPEVFSSGPGFRMFRMFRNLFSSSGLSLFLFCLIMHFFQA